MIASLLIANRGEIACRIIRTARRMGIRTVAVYSDADAGALHVRQADAAVHIGASPARQSYLLGHRIIAAAKETGAEAIHPGYGFLSENADFAQAVIDAGLIWVGPSPESIRAMGLKDAAKARMIAAGVPVTSGYLGEDQSPERLAREADAIGYPVLIKAVAGGGGKGMRRVEDAAAFADALESCRREAASSFGDDRVLLEKYILSPRHIEVQVFGDTHGNVVHLFERDCSLQRRHQKVIEEAPAPGMDPETREAICAAAVRAAQAVDYIGAGTIEFIADASEGLRADRIWFMEMNTRLQVEHPVTEAITGVDLVEWQLQVAAGEKLPKRQNELSIDGWAMEARLYAEDPARGFLPSVGRLERFRLPTSVPTSTYLSDKSWYEIEASYPGHVRIETCVDEGSTVSPFYDPMIAKLICHADDRRAAALGLALVVGSAEVWPLKTNAAFLHALLVNPDFTGRRVHTGFIDDHADDVIFAADPPASLLARAAEALTMDEGREALAGFRLNAAPVTRARMVDRGDVFVGDRITPLSHDQRRLGTVTREGDGVYVTDMGTTWRFTAERHEPGVGAAAGSGILTAPMPGRITAVTVQEDAIVTAGQTLVTLEAMKMEQALVAPFAGRVAEVRVEIGAQVSEGALLVRVENDGDLPRSS